MLQSLSNLLSLDGRSGQLLVGAVIALVVAAAAYGLYRLVFAHRIRAPSAGRGRAPRLGVVDVFSLDGQRQLVIVRRDNTEHLLMIGGPNDLVIEPQILRNSTNGREAVKPQAAPEALAEPAAPVPPAAAPRPIAPAAPAPAPTPRRTPVEAAAPPPVVAVPRPDRPAVEPAPEVRSPRPAAKAEIAPPKPPAEAPPSRPKPAEAEIEQLPLPKPALDIARKPAPPAPPRPAAPVTRPNLPSPITPLRPRAAPEVAPEPPRPAPDAPKPTETPILAPPPAAVTPPAEPARPRKDEAFYDLESLEAEMARLLGRDG